MKHRLVYLLTAGLLAVSAAFAVTGSAAGASPPAPVTMQRLLAGTASGSDCVQLGTLHSYNCAFHAPGTGGGVYLLDVLFENWYYWHPKTGDMVVDETYVKAGAPFFVNPFHRDIHFSSTAQVADSKWLADFPHNKVPPASCDTAGVTEACTSVEQRSAMDFQHAMVADNIHHSL